MFECFMTMLFYRWPHWTLWQCFPSDWREQTVAFNAWGERSSHSSLGIQSQSIDERYTDYRRRKRTLSKGKFYFSQGLVHFDNERRQQQQQKIMKILQTFTKINPHSHFTERPPPYRHSVWKSPNLSHPKRIFILSQTFEFSSWQKW